MPRGSTWAGRPRPTTWGSPATGWSAVWERPAPTSPRSGTPTATTFSNTGLAASTTYRYRVRAVDAAGNLGAYSAIATATTPAAPDTTAPSAPTGLTATAISTTQIDLSWTASTDNVGVTGYRVERCQGASCTTWAQVADTDGDHVQQHGAGGEHHLPLPGARRRRCREPGCLLLHRGQGDARPRHDGADGPDVAHGHADQHDPDRPRLDRLDRRGRGHRLPGGALPGGGLHRLRPGGDTDRHLLQRHRPDALDDLPVPGAGNRCGRQPQRLLRDRHGDDAGRSRHHCAVGADGVDRDPGCRPGEPGVDGLDRQRGGHRLPRRALPGCELHRLRPGRYADRDHVHGHRADGPRRPTATGCGRSTRRGT